MCDFALSTDITQHKTELNITPQTANHLVNELFQKITVFQMKFQLWELKLWSNNKTQCPILKTNKFNYAKKYTQKIQLLEHYFNSHFQVIHKHKDTINLFSVLLGINTEMLPVDFQMEMIDMQCWYAPEKYILTWSILWLLQRGA